jgi:hypothetical protein
VLDKEPGLTWLDQILAQCEFPHTIWHHVARVEEAGDNACVGGGWLLVAGCWLLVAGCWLLVLRF